MQKVIRLKEVNRITQLIRTVREHLNSNINNNSYQTIGGGTSSSADPRTEKTKALFEMFHLT
jgi:hypothetical protein